ncbi:oligosaccharyl transferase-like protein, putative [Bodo saltans]|uniref:Oligosaccharyl transferase-like protein, putative n=1 Tax=Bodo saltans TaxID=75058 RepID=A0A0S4IZ92_BODSA|nr:oligosaccharyl transferase-like protein, putative [Bodo saltans]|eukprot:CUG28716.1 oligosaccharyl transferase-like protein, putative [Bodo saltans]
MMKGRLNNGKTVIVDDYRESYLWLKNKTPEDSRVMAWWDYGYQITGIGNRTSIADGNTWNHEHIATLGKCLSSPVKESHSLIRHLADYVLIWAGGDDLGKSPHMARIGNSVYRDICPNDPLCSHFGFYDGYSMRKPTPMMKASLLYNLAVVGEDPSVKLDPKLFKEVSHCEELAKQFSEPQIMMKGRLNNGKTVIVDDYRESYLWLKNKTPEDSRVMAWWDYGYQITGIGNRTSIADGNTWNHEHIATLGKCLSSPVKESHSLIRHLADYVLIWAGGDDLGKSPHMARIGNSVYRDICPNDPLCSHFGFHDQQQMKPSPMMKASLLYNLAMLGQNPAVKLDPALFSLVKTTKYGKVKVYKVNNVSQESKDWVANPANRVCDAPGSWYCNGQYPPAPEIQQLLAKRRDFGQLEDFNRKKKDDKYHSDYMKKFGGSH